MTRLILVPLDGSAFSAGALPAAAAIARRRRAPLHLVAVYTPMVVPLPFPGGPEYDTRFDEEQRDAHRQALRRYADRLREESGVAATWAVIDGDPAEALAAEAKAQGAELLVLTTHGAGGFERAWLGSVADELVRRSPAPLLLIRPAGAGDRTAEDASAVLAPVADAGQPPLANEGGSYAFRRVLVPLDGSPLAEEILAPALDLVASDDATFVLLRVVPVPRTEAPDERTFWMPREERAIEGARREAHAYLEGVAARLRAAGRPAEPCIVLHHDPARAIIQESGARGVDLVAIGTHARAGLARLRLGSVADKVVRGAPCPTLVARPRGAPAPR